MQNKSKLFVGITIPGQIQNLLWRKTQKWQGLPIVWSKKENLHITLLYLGYADVMQIPDICRRVCEACGEIEAFEVVFDSLELGPDLLTARLVWATGEANEELKALFQAVEQSLDRFAVDKKTFRPHITLGRVRKQKWQAISEKPTIQESVRIPVEVTAVTVFESVNNSGSRRYEPLEVCELL